MTAVPRQISVAIMEFYLDYAPQLMRNQTTRRLEAGKQKAVLITQLQNKLMNDFGVTMDDKQIRTHWQNKKSQIMRKAKEVYDQRDALKNAGVNLSDSDVVPKFDCPTEQRVLECLLSFERSSFENMPGNDVPHGSFLNRKRTHSVKPDASEIAFKLRKLENSVSGDYMSVDIKDHSFETPDPSPNKSTNLETLLPSANVSAGFVNSPQKSPSSLSVDIQSLLSLILREELERSTPGSSVPSSPIINAPTPLPTPTAERSAVNDAFKHDLMTSGAIEENSNPLMEAIFQTLIMTNASLQPSNKNEEPPKPTIDDFIQMQETLLKQQESFFQTVMDMMSTTTHLVKHVLASLMEENSHSNGSKCASSLATSLLDDESHAPVLTDRFNANGRPHESFVAPLVPSKELLVVPPFPPSSRNVQPTFSNNARSLASSIRSSFKGRPLGPLCSPTASIFSEGRFVSPVNNVPCTTTAKAHPK